MAGTGTAHLRDADDTVLRVEDLVVEFPAKRNEIVHAVSGISFDVLEGETVGLVGESGCGKSTTGRAVLQLPSPTSGSIRYRQIELTELSKPALRRYRAQLQMIFQDPISSLNPRRRIKDIVAEGLSIWGDIDKDERDKRVTEALEAVGLDPELVGDRFPGQFSGGQCQRICIARALALDPSMLICDEPVSALDVSVQAQILNILEAMKARYGLTMMFIAHDLAVIKSISDRIIVMYLGKICEVAAPDDLFSKPLHPYTDILISSIPEPNPHREQSKAAIVGELPSPIDPPSGCRFRTRCPNAQERCAVDEPVVREAAPGHFVACHFPNG